MFPAGQLNSPVASLEVFIVMPQVSTSARSVLNATELNSLSFVLSLNLIERFSTPGMVTEALVVKSNAG